MRKWCEIGAQSKCFHEHFQRHPWRWWLTSTTALKANGYGLLYRALVKSGRFRELFREERLVPSSLAAENFLTSNNDSWCGVWGRNSTLRERLMSTFWYISIVMQDIFTTLNCRQPLSITPKPLSRRLLAPSSSKSSCNWKLLCQVKLL